jgi:hypothetical protein
MTSRNTPQQVGASSQNEAAVEKDKFGKKLYAYALAASVGAILLPTEATAKIAYTSTYVHTIGPIQGISIDLDHNGMVDFVIASSDFSGDNWVSVRPSVTGNQILSTSIHALPEATALRPGAYIGPGAKFSAKANYMRGSYSCRPSQWGPWAYARDHYLGFEFLIRGKIHYGWARLNVGPCATAMTGFAYETVPNRPIQAGLTQSSDDMNTLTPRPLAPKSIGALQPATLGLLAQGASGIVVWRRKELDDGVPS